MRLLFTACLLFAFPLLAFTEDSKPATIEFQEETYTLKFAQGNQFQAINEYVPEGETLEEWSSLIAVREYANRRDYQELAGGLIKALSKNNPLTHAAIHTSPDGKRAMVDFVTWDLDQKITEFNIFIYQVGADGNSVLVQQYAERAYGKEEGLELLRDLKDRRPKLLAEIIEFPFPSLAKK